MEGPALKRPKLQLDTVKVDDWGRWSNNLNRLEQHLSSGCLCHLETLELQRPIYPYQDADNSAPKTTNIQPQTLEFLRDYACHFISTLNFLSDTALQQTSEGYVCRKVLDMASGVAMDEGIWEMLIEYLNSTDKFISHATSNCLVALLMWTKLPNLNEIFDELFNSVMTTTNNPLKLSRILDVIRGVIQYTHKYRQPIEEQEQVPPDPEPDPHESPKEPVDDNPPNADVSMIDVSVSTAAAAAPAPPPSTTPNLSTPSSSSSRPICCKVEVEAELDSEVKSLCVKALDNWWNRLLEKFQNMMAYYEPQYDASLDSFLSLWTSIVSVKNSVSVIDAKNYYMHLKHFVPLLNPNSPPIVWRKLTDVFNEILCYGSALSLQGIQYDEPCDLAHQIIRCVRSRQFLQGIPYSRDFFGFGGSTFGPVDWGWKSESKLGTSTSQQYATTTQIDASRTMNSNHPSSSIHLQDPLPSSSSSNPLPSSSKAHLPQCSNELKNEEPKPSPPMSLSGQDQATEVSLPTFPISQTIYIGPSRSAVQLDESSIPDNFGDRPLLQKVVLLVLKSIAVTVQETNGESSSDSDEETVSNDGDADVDGSMHSPSDEDDDHHGSEEIEEGNDMAYIERTIREVFLEVDLYVKSVQPFHPGTPLGEWVVKLFVDQDDSLIEAMLCVLDTYRGFLGKSSDVPQDFKEMFHPVKTFVAFLASISFDKDVPQDLLMGNETCFLAYFLFFLKFSSKNWPEFVTFSGRELERTMSVLIRLRMSIGRLVEHSLYPYNISPVLRLLEKCEELYESDNNSTSANDSSAVATTTTTSSSPPSATTASSDC